MKTVEAGPQLQRILYATDFSPNADKAGQYAAALARSSGSALDIVNVLPSPVDERGDDVWHSERTQCEERLRRASLDLQLKGTEVHSSVVTECPPSLAISLRQRRTGADFVVVATESKSSLDRLFLGSTAEALIRESAVPVLTVGPHAKAPRSAGPVFEKIVLATDFSPTSERAEELAIAFARSPEAHLYVFHVSQYQLGEANSRRWAAETTFRNKLSRAIPQEHCEFLNSRDDEGHVSQSIVRLANRVHADVIIMGARERSFWLLHFRRGVTQDVLAQAECPVLTAR